MNDDRGHIRPELESLIVPIRTVHTYPGNARRGDTTKIRDSLLTHGQYKPLLAQSTTGHIVVGNNTLHVMRDHLQWTCCAVMFLELDDVAARKMLLMDNASSDQADYDTSSLVDLLAGLPEFAGSGFWEMDLDRLLAELTGETPLDSLPSITDALPVSPAAGPPLPAYPTADPFPIPAPGPIPTPAPVPDPIPVPAPVPPADPRTQLPPVLPPVTRGPGPGPDTEVPFHLTLTRTDREEALRLLAHARDWLDPDLTPPDTIMRALRVLAAIGDARHNPTATLNITTLLMAAGRDPFTGAHP